MNLKQAFLTTIIVIMMLVSMPVFANSNLRGHAVYVPAGVTLRAVLSQEINSRTAHIGQNVNCVLMEDFYYNNTLIIPMGSTIMGTIIKSSRAGVLFRGAKVEVRFSSVRTPYNNIIPVSAVIVTKDSDGILRANASSENVKNAAQVAAVSAGSGAVAGVIAGAISDSTVGKGALYGTAIGLGIGIIKGAFTKGEEIVIPTNAQLDIVFEQPITLSAK